jgi:hypothetical protein
MCPLSEKLKTWNSAAPPRRHTGFLWPHADPGPNHSPRSPDSQFLEPFRLRPPKPPPGANGATPGRSRARRSRGEIPEFQFSVFWGRESETPRTRRVISEPSPSRYLWVSLHFRHFGIGQFRFGTGSGSGQVRAVLIRCTSWVFIMCRAISTAKLE